VVLKSAITVILKDLYCKLGLSTSEIISKLSVQSLTSYKRVKILVLTTLLTHKEISLPVAGCATIDNLSVSKCNTCEAMSI